MSQPQANYAVHPQRVSEHEEQANFIETVTFQYGHRADFSPVLLFSVPNGAWFGGKNPHALMNKFKREGFRPGVADLIYLQPRGPYNCLAIEMKATDQRNLKNGGLSPQQAEFLAAVNANGGTGETCYGCDEALNIFAWYMSLPI